MREIKFRAWDANASMMTIPDELPTLMARYFSHGGWIEGLSLMQFTGLTDKNGMHIYEGDLLSLDGEAWCAVEWNDGAFHIVPLGSKGKSPLIQERAKRLEVVGDIHHHHWLLEQSDEN